MASRLGTMNDSGRGTKFLGELREFVAFLKGLWGVLTGFSVLFPLSSVFFEVIPVKTGAEDGAFWFLSPRLITAVATLLTLFIVLSTFSNRSRLSGIGRRSWVSFGIGVSALIIYLVIYAIKLNIYDITGWESGDLRHLILEVPLLVFYSVFFAFVTKAFTLLGLLEFYRETEIAPSPTDTTSGIVRTSRLALKEIERNEKRTGWSRGQPEHKHLDRLIDLLEQHPSLVGERIDVLYELQKRIKALEAMPNISAAHANTSYSRVATQEARALIKAIIAEAELGSTPNQDGTQREEENRKMELTLPPTTRDGWTYKGNWEILDGHAQNWIKVGEDYALGRSGGYIFHKNKLPKNCILEFEATLLAQNGSDEIDVVIWDVMILFYREGIRQDIMTKDLNHEPFYGPIAYPAPQVGHVYHFKIHKHGTECSYLIDGSQMMPFDCNHHVDVVSERWGFAHHQNKVEFKNVRMQPIPE